MKKELREKYKLIRKNIKNKKEKSNIIFNKIINCEEYKKSKIIAIYKNLKDEVETNDLVEYSIKDKIVCLPKVVGDNLIFIKTNNKDFEIGSFGIEEPIGEEIDTKEIDLFIIPGICFDKELNRIGFGKGYYDKVNYNNSKRIGICFEEQICDEIIDVDKYDIKMNKVITNKNIYN